MGDPHPLSLGQDTATSSPKPSSGGHENQLFGDLELRCLWAYQGWCLLGWAPLSPQPPTTPSPRRLLVFMALALGVWTSALPLGRVGLRCGSAFNPR